MTLVGLSRKLWREIARSSLDGDSIKALRLWTVNNDGDLEDRNLGKKISMPYWQYPHSGRYSGICYLYFPHLSPNYSNHNTSSTAIPIKIYARLHGQISHLQLCYKLEDGNVCAQLVYILQKLLVVEYFNCC